MQVGYVAQQVAKTRSKRGYDPPTDPKFSQEWYLVSAGGSGEGRGGDRVERGGGWEGHAGKGGEGKFLLELLCAVLCLCRKMKEVRAQQRVLT